MEQTKLVFIIYDEGIRPDVMEVLEQQGLGHFTVWRNAQGAGETGPRQGNPIWPGLNDVMMVAMAESAVAPLVEALHAVRDRFPIRPGLRFIITDATFI